MSEEIKKNKPMKLSGEELEGIAGGKITFKPLSTYLKAHGITIHQLLKDGVIVPSDVTRISCDHNYPLKFIDKLCGYLQCQPGDIIAYIPENEAGISLSQVMAGM